MEQRKKVTINTIAETFSVSPSTVSRAFDPTSRISDETRNAILEYASKNGYTPNRTASRLSMDEINITVAVTNLYALAEKEFLKGVYDGYSSLRDLKINLTTKAVGNESDLPSALREIVGDGNGIDGFIASGFSDPESISILNGLRANDKSLVLLQADVPGVNRLFAVGHDYECASRMAAEYIAGQLRFSNDKSVAIFTGDRRTFIHRRSAEAFASASKEFGLNIVASYDMNDSEEALLRQVKELFEKKALLPSAIYITSGLSLSLCNYIKEHGLSNRVILITTDVYPEMSEYLRDGTVKAVIYQNLRKQAKLAFTKLVSQMIGEENDKKPNLIVPELVIKSNLKYYEEN